MIDARELRIGNVVAWGVHTVKVACIHSNYVGKDGILVVDMHHVWVDFGIGEVARAKYDHDISPIPLTEEWLIRAGFSQSYSSDPQEPNASEMFKKDKFTLHLPSGILPFIYQPFDGDLIEIRYLHQLQNIYCTLTGIELEFTKDI